MQAGGYRKIDVAQYAVPSDLGFSFFLCSFSLCYVTQDPAQPGRTLAVWANGARVRDRHRYRERRPIARLNFGLPVRHELFPLQACEEPTKPYMLTAGYANDDRLTDEKITAHVQKLCRIVIGFANNSQHVGDEITIRRKFEQLLVVVPFLFQ